MMIYRLPPLSTCVLWLNFVCSFLISKSSHVLLQTLSEATALASSVDGKYLFAGLPNGLAAADALSQQILSQWEEDGVEIISIQTYNFTPTAILLVTVDDMGWFHTFTFCGN